MSFVLAFVGSVMTAKSLGEFAADRRFRVITVDYRESQGACWARHSLQAFYGGETYTLQLDSHHRFAPGWDNALIDLFRGIESEKPLLTTYLPSYEPTSARREAAAWIIGFDRFSREGILLTRPNHLPGPADQPVPARFYSAHFAFTFGKFCEEVRHDPNLYFHGEEITLAVRAFTHGYDLFHPHRVLAWHEYTRGYRRRHWDDHVAGNGVAKAWHLRDLESQRRCRVLLGMEPGQMDFGQYGLGNKRTLEDYQRYSGIHFALRLAQSYTLEGRFPPNPEVYGLEEWQARCTKEFETTIALHRRDLPERSDFDFGTSGSMTEMAVSCIGMTCLQTRSARC